MQHTLQSKYGKISYWDSVSEGHPLLFIHGNSSCKEVFSKQLSSTVFNEHRLVAIDLPGHGASECATDVNSVYSIAHYAELVREVCHTLDLDEPLLIGWSLGGHIAIEAVAQGLKVRGMLITGTPPFGPGLDDVNSAFHESEHMALTGKACFSDEDSKAYAAATLGGDSQVTEHLLSKVKECDGRFREALMSNWASPDAGHSAVRFIETFEQPMAVIHGESDPFVNLEYLENLNWNSLWRGEVTVIPGAGHAAFREQPNRFNTILSSFSASLFDEELR